jgi:hypothetical protein
MAELVYLNPMMDYSNKGGSHRFITSCIGFEIKDGLVQDIRKIRFFDIDNVTRGFITDNFDEGYQLCSHMPGLEESELIHKYPDIAHYLENTPKIKRLPIALSVRAFIQGVNTPRKAHLLDFLDLNQLEEAKIDIHKYISKKPFEGS